MAPLLRHLNLWRGPPCPRETSRIKLAGRDGTSNVTKVLLALQWLLANKDTYGVRVVNLSLRVDSNLSYRLGKVWQLSSERGSDRASIAT